MKTRYYTDEGKVFDNKDEAQAYENELAQVKAKREKLEQEKQARRDEIKADYEALVDKIAAYNKDYNEPVKWEGYSFGSPMCSLRSSLFDLLNRFGW